MQRSPDQKPAYPAPAIHAVLFKHARRVLRRTVHPHVAGGQDRHDGARAGAVQLNAAQIVVLLQMMQNSNLPEPKHATAIDVEYRPRRRRERRRRHRLELLLIAPRLLRRLDHRAGGAGGQGRSRLRQRAREEGGSTAPSQTRTKHHGASTRMSRCRAKHIWRFEIGG